ncbi:magnesium chelatase subunit D family protein [Aeromicrobium sp. Leaf350]|uniref:magnesium chelatase subunit D family protein n=1 Tax=Aeromicrobium sp. Leaf350 TaxID=2876565 RepID=UPI001E4CF4F7|nr:magnesium chelatase subunit D family protein [Aeromicrobium sp. Leaf350]
MPRQYPFTAVVGSDDMALALVLATISPSIGGVLVRGEKGTAKSTMVRALAAVLPPIDVVAGDRFSSDPRDANPLSPDGPFGPEPEVETRPVRLVELPVGASEDRVLGSLHLQKALSEGVTEYEPGLLAKAHRGILYVDEVNLLHDHLVDLLLDAAAMGRSTVERDGVSVEHAARFVLIGTMNPEEGELRPQLLDRFGLTVDVAAPRDPQLRAEVTRRRLAFDSAPETFAQRFAAEETALTERLSAAQDLLEQVLLTDDDLVRIAEICAAFDVDGMRADIVTARAAVAHAAWQGRTHVTTEDIRVAARLALPHRRRRNPFDAPGIDQQQLDDLLGDDEPPTDGPDDEGPHDDGPGGGTPPSGPDGSDDGGHGDAADDGGPSEPGPTPPAGDSGEQQGQGSGTTTTAQAGEPSRARLFTVDGLGTGEAGRRSRALTSNGRRVGARRPEGSGGRLDLPQTLWAAAPHQALRRPQPGTPAGRVLLEPTDLRVAITEGRESNLVLFCVDASGSMAARKRMEQVKTAILSLLLDAYQRRDKVGLVTFRGDSAELALPPTGSIDIAARRLDDLPAGGRTPLAEGLLQVVETLRIERVRDPRRRPLLVLVTDGRATHGSDAVARSQRAAALLGHVETVVVDCETGRMSLGLARRLAEVMDATYLPLGDVTADALTTVVREVA